VELLSLVEPLDDGDPPLLEGDVGVRVGVGVTDFVVTLVGVAVGQEGILVDVGEGVAVG